MNCKEFNLSINKEEHLMFMFNTSRNVLKELIKFIKIIDQIGFNYDFNQKFGYLT